MKDKNQNVLSELQQKTANRAMSIVQETNFKRIESKFRFYRNITSITVIFLGILIGLHPSNFSEFGLILYLAGCSSITGSVIFSLVIQSYEEKVYKSINHSHIKMLKSFYEGDDVKGLTSVLSKTPSELKTYKSLLWGCFICGVILMFVYIGVSS